MAENDSESGTKAPFPGYPGGRTYYLSIPVRPLSGDIPDEHLERVTLYYSTYGLVFAIVGAIAIVGPLVFGIAILPLLAWTLVLGGAVTLLQFILICGAPGTTAFMLLGALHMAAGLFILLQTTEAIKMLTWLFAAWFLAHGVIKILMSCQLSKLTTWPAVLVSGMISVGIAAVVLLVTDRFGLKLIALLFGSDLALTGISLLLIACMAYLGKGDRSVSDVDARHEPLLHGRGPPAAAVNV